jgi:HAD superfamily hydrolase (TIGR01484 family)
MNINDKKLIVFDLDGTLAPSKSALEADMASLLVELLLLKKVAVISGGGYPQFQAQLLQSLPAGVDSYANLFLLPTSGTRMYVWRGMWYEQYAEHLTPAEKKVIMAALKDVLTSDYVQPEKIYGEIIEDRGSQITFSALGQAAPIDLKLAWDPDRTKREGIADKIRARIPQFDVRVGGSTSIDITRRGVNKGYGIRKLEEYFKMSQDEMIFVGDALFHGGNDYPVKATGVDCIQVAGPAETKKLVANWLAESQLLDRIQLERRAQ